MKRPRDLALRFVALAERDARTLAVLASSPDVDDEPVGFHAQQAVEKCLKAVLVLHRVPFRKTHDLDELLDMVTEHDLPQPPYANELDELNPYGVLLRYDLGENSPLDRQQVQRMVHAVQSWAADLVGEQDA